MRWVQEAKQGANSLLLGWLGVVLGQVHPDPEERLTGAQAAERLQQLHKTLGDGTALAIALSGA
jgi:hypothetical protein